MGHHVRIGSYYVNAMGVEAQPGELPDPYDVDWCRHFLAEETIKTKKVDTSRTSYGWKHDVERWIKSLGLRHEHISNGAFIVAALERGHEHKYPKDSLLHRDAPLNVCFNVRRKRK